MPVRETGKQRALRVPLDYFKKPDALERWKLGLLIGAMVAALAWWGSGFLRGGDGDAAIVSRGPVASPHSAWDQNCNVCHIPFQPVTTDKGWVASAYTILGVAPQDSSQKCQTCHTGPAHHGNLKEELACAACHRDHRGLDASLISKADNDCTRCHGDLKDHIKDKSLYENAIEAKVTRFDTDHPEFRSTKKDPGGLKFNHRLHLTPGILPGADPSDPKGKVDNKFWTLDKIADPEARKRFAQAQGATDMSDPVQLNCNSCHFLDSSDVRKSRPGGVPTDYPPAGSSGAYMLPVTYENSCKACHPLTYTDEKAKKYEGDHGVKDIPPPPGPLAIPHHLQPEQVKDFLIREYTAQFVKDPGTFLKDFTFDPKDVARPIPGRPLPFVEKIDTAKKVVMDRVEKAEKILFLGKTTCGECHNYEDPSKLPNTKIVPTNVPEVWLKHARFDHAAHRAVACADCHKDVEKSVSSSDVMMPKLEDCRTCHAPASMNQGKAAGGVRYDCTTCHRYHQGWEPGGPAAVGIGVSGRGIPFDQRRKSDEFLSGKTPGR